MKKYSIVYNSNTGNTEQLANKIQEILPREDCIYFGEVNSKAVSGEIIFAGFWTDKGICSNEFANFLESLHDKRIFLFGTAGFGGSEEYFTAILSRVSAYIDNSNIVEGSFMCQGKMPIIVRQRYESMQKDSPEKAKELINNFDCASTHPDENDFEKLEYEIKNIYK